MLVLIKVTHKLLNSGIRSSCTECAISLAIKRLVKRPELVSVGISKINLGLSEAIELPLNAYVWRQLYDKGLRVGPTSFELFIPDNLLKPEVLKAN
jgi:hypothetical protein